MGGFGVHTVGAQVIGAAAHALGGERLDCVLGDVEKLGDLPLESPLILRRRITSRQRSGRV